MKHYTLPDDGRATQRSWSVSGSEAKVDEMAQHKMKKIVQFVGDMIIVILFQKNGYYYLMR